MHWTGLWLGTGLTVLFAYVWLFVGSSRADAESQMTILFCLILAFGTVTIGVGLQTWLITKRAVRWRGKTIRFTSRATAETREFGEIESANQTIWGSFTVEFRDGAVLKLDPNAKGAYELISAVADFLDVQPKGTI